MVIDTHRSGSVLCVRMRPTWVAGMDGAGSITSPSATHGTGLSTRGVRI